MAYRFTPADRGAFKRCRRQWDFGARERQGDEPARPAPALDLDLAAGEALLRRYFEWARPGSTASPPSRSRAASR